MKNASGIAQFFLRLTLGLGFILPVMDRLGLLGPPGSAGVAWGDFKHFVTYSNILTPYLNTAMAKAAAILATVAEIVFGICLIIGLKIKQTALGAALLTLTFGVSMAVFVGISAPFTYPVFVFTGAALVLSGLGRYKWSVDDWLTTKSQRNSQINP